MSDDVFTDTSDRDTMPPTKGAQPHAPQETNGAQRTPAEETEGAPSARSARASRGSTPAEEAAARPPAPALRVTDDIDLLLDTLPTDIRAAVEHEGDTANLLEIVMDLGRPPCARFSDREAGLSKHEITHETLNEIVRKIGEFGQDNRAGIARTLHRISCLRNRRGDIVGLTMRVGRAVYGTIRAIDDLVASGQSLLLLGRPGVGKTTMLRETARILAERGKRVVVVDTSNEIAGDGDIPHPGIGAARRMQVPAPALQHAVMVEAVENHMPEVIVIDEIGTELEALAARTIAERGVQLVATAHGNSLDNLLMNPTLSDLIGGIQSVTLSDEEARRRGTRKSVLERKAPPTFEILVEIQSFSRVAVHRDIARTVDALLRNHPVRPQVREMDQDGEVHASEGQPLRSLDALAAAGGRPPPPFAEDLPDGAAADEAASVAAPTMSAGPHRRVFPFGVSPARLTDAIRETGANASVVESATEADAVMTLRSMFRRRAAPIRSAEARGLPIYVLKHNTVEQMEQGLRALMRGQSGFDHVTAALAEAEDAIEQIGGGAAPSLELSPQNAYIRRLQHQIAERHALHSISKGREPYRRVRLYRP